MRYANCEQDGRTFAATVEGDTVRPLDGVPPITAGFDLDALAAADPGAPVPLADVRLRAPVLAPGKVICLGLNYKAHVEESERDLPEYPVLFTKFPEAIIGPYDDIVAPPESAQVDYEAEMAVVIGRRARRIAPSDALGVVAGLTVANDVTMRDFQYRTHQWLQGKAWPRTTPLGPWLVTGDEVGDGAALDIRLNLDGVQMQESNTSRMIFDVPTIVSTLSEFVELAPGDVILTGTPGGVGFRRDPQVFLEPGRRVRVEIEGLGAIESTVVAEDTGG